MPHIMQAFPPNYRKINKKFNVRGKPIIFAYNGTIYNPSRIQIPPQLVIHEQTHMARQNGNAEYWWDCYIEDAEFRLAEEIPAHIAEYRAIAYRNDAHKLLERIAARLASPLYGSMIKLGGAREAILHGAAVQMMEPTTTTGQ